MTRDAAYAALFARLQAVSAFRTHGRRLRLLEELGQGELPALFLTVGNQETRRQRGLPPLHILTAHVFVYAGVSDPHAAPGAALNALLDAVEAAIEPVPGQDAQTLGGQVHSCRIEGTTEVFEGTQGDRAAAIVPIQMIVP
jgi:hypothetical protein